MKGILMRNYLTILHQKMIQAKCARDMRPYKESRSGRCFIIGNGPSLKIADLELLQNEVTFASNRIYGLFDRTSWRPTYYASQDDGVILEIKDKLLDVSRQVQHMFLNGNVMRVYSAKLKQQENVSFMYIRPTAVGKKSMDIDVPNGIHNGINISYTMIELAIYMGFTEIYLLGIDHNYVTKINQQGETVLDGNSSANYFTGIAPLKYEAKVTEKDLSLLMDASTAAYQNAKTYAAAHGIKIYNATRGGHLEVFERVNFDDVVKEVNQ